MDAAWRSPVCAAGGEELCAKEAHLHCLPSRTRVFPKSGLWGLPRGLFVLQGIRTREGVDAGGQKPPGLTGYLEEEPGLGVLTRQRSPEHLPWDAEGGA